MNEDPILIAGSNILLQCGKDGSSGNNCTFEGGDSHLAIADGSRNVEVKGIRFKAAAYTSVIIDGSLRKTSAFFSDSHWLGNTGTWNVAILGPVCVEARDALELCVSDSLTADSSGTCGDDPNPTDPSFFSGFLDVDCGTSCSDRNAM